MERLPSGGEHFPWNPAKDKDVNLELGQMLSNLQRFIAWGEGELSRPALWTLDLQPC